MKTHSYLLLLALIINACGNQDVSNIVVEKNITGTWAISQVYANDHWGGAISWKNATFYKQVRFSADLKYYSKTDKDFQLIGTYKVISEEQIEITWDVPIILEYPTYLQHFEFDADGCLILPTGTYEGVVLEKYKLIKR